MPEGHRHLTHGERCQIGALKESGLSDGAIAARLGRDRSSVWRELRRNAGGGGGYSPGEAQGRAEARRSAASSVPRRMTPDRWARVEGLLAEGWSPEQVAGRLRLEGGWTVGRQWTSGRVRADRKAGGRLFLLLRRRGKRPNWRGGRRSGRGHIPGRMDISGRPDEAGRKERVGDREADTIIGRGHAGVAAELGAAFFLPTPNHSWERGLNGHTNGLAPQYLPKGTDLRAVSDAEVRAVQDRADARPRRALGYRTPAEALHKARPP